MENNTDYQEQKLKPIIEHAKSIAQKKEATPPFIAIAGCSAVGKSYFANELTRLLKYEGITSAILKFDDFLNPGHFDSSQFQPRLEHTLAHSVIEKIKRGEKAIKKPAWNIDLNSKVEEIFSLEGINFLLFEGEFTLCENPPYNFSQYCAFSIFIDANDEDIIEWNWNRARNIKEKNKEKFAEKVVLDLQKYRTFIRSNNIFPTYLLLKDANHCYSLQTSTDFLEEDIS